LLVEQRAACGLTAQNEILEGCQPLEQLKALLHHADSTRERVVRSVRPNGLASELDRPLVGRDESEHDRHQCALSSTVLPDNGVNRAPRDGEVDAIVRNHRPVALCDPAQNEMRPALGMICDGLVSPFLVYLNQRG
jgi:hypothetical protein